MGLFEKMLEQNGGAFACGDTITLADFQLFAQLMDFHYAKREFTNWRHVTKWHAHCMTVKSLSDVHGEESMFMKKVVPFMQ